MKRYPWFTHPILVLLLFVSLGAAPAAAADAAKVTVNWDKVVRVSKTTATLQVVVNPPLRRGSAIHDRVFQVLRDLRADYVRYVPWLPYPKLGVAELDPPQSGRTSWDFSLIDPLAIDFFEATAGHPVIINFSTIPQWMFKTPKPIAYPSDPDQATWDYEQGIELRDPAMKEVGEYYGRLASWYAKGGFSDENGQWHGSSHHYKIDYWEVLNEVDFEHQMSPETYTALYDAVVEAVRRVSPETKFVGLALAAPTKAPKFFEYFLNHQNHKPGIPLDMVSYHFYATPTTDQKPETYQFTFFDQAERFLDSVRYIESIRERLSPETRTTVDEIGAISSDDFSQGEPGYVFKPIPAEWWNLCAAVYAYLYAELARLGIDAAGESQLVGYPTQFPSVSMVDWSSGQPNARYWALKLLRDNFGPSDKLVETGINIPYVYAQGFSTPDGKRKVLLVNKRERPVEAALPGSAGAVVEVVDQTTGLQAPVSTRLKADSLTLAAFAVAVVTFPR